MGTLSKKLRNAEGGRVMFLCPGCNSVHQITVTDDPNRQGPIWSYNNNPEFPTFEPSILVQWASRNEQRVCHSFVREGRIQFLDDCTHSLKGQTVDLPDWNLD